MAPRHRWLIAAALFAVAMATRIPLLDDLHFAGDEAGYYSTAREIADGLEFPMLGPANSSGGHAPGPLFQYLMAIPQLVSRAPEASSFLVALLAALSSVLLYDGLRRFFGDVGGASAGFVYAVGTWPAITTAMVWNPYTGSSVVALALWAALRVRHDAKSRLVAVAVAAALCIPCFHLTGVVVWPALFLVAGPSLRRLNWRWFAIGIASALLLYAPGIVSELRTGFENLSAVFAAEDRYAVDIKGGWEWAPVYLLRYLTTDVSYFVLQGFYGGLDEARALALVWDGDASLPFHPLRFAAMCGSVAVALACVLWPAVRRARSSGPADRTALALFFALAIALAGAMLLLYVTKQQIYGHYLLVLLPFAVALVAPLGESVARGRVGRGLLVAWLAVFAIASWDATRIVAVFDAPAGLAVQRAVVERILDDRAREGGTSQIRIGIRGPSEFTLTTIANHAYDEPLVLRPGGERLYLYQMADAPLPTPLVGEPTAEDGARLYRVR